MPSGRFDYVLGAADVEIDTLTLNRVLELQKLPDDLKDKLYYFIDMTIHDFEAKQSFAS